MDAFIYRRLARIAGCAGMALSLLAGVAPPASAQSIHKCTDVEGRIAYQDHACNGAQRASVVEIASAPSGAASPEYAIGTRSARTASRASPRRSGKRAEVMSFECRADNGEVFYRHSGCPGSIRVDSAGGRAARRGDAPESARVSATRVPRAQACRRLAAAGSIGRAGHARDEQVSTYERNAGRDPCRRF
jgi:hypothetical protein